jgi:hypothetical protein
MHKLSDTINLYTLSELKRQIAVKLRFPIIGKPDCFKLSEVLLNEGYGSVSVSTLYRLFINYKGTIPYRHTLDILANYTGYLCWADFIDNLEIKKNNYSLIQPREVSSSLIFHCMASEAYNPLTSFFESIEVSEYKYKIKVALEVYDSLLSIEKPELFFLQFNKNKFVKQYVLEDAFDPAFRVKNYAYAFKLYEKDLDIDNSLMDIQDYVFSQSVLFRHYFLSGNSNYAFSIGTKIYKQTPVISSNLDAIFIFPNIRFRAYKIWFYQLIGASKNTIEDYVLELLDYCKNRYNELTSVEKKIILHSLAEVFCYSNIDTKYHLILKTIFKQEFLAIPIFLFEKPLQKSLPYFEANGLLHYRPIH